MLITSENLCYVIAIPNIVRAKQSDFEGVIPRSEVTRDLTDPSLALLVQDDASRRIASSLVPSKAGLAPRNDAKLVFTILC